MWLVIGELFIRKALVLIGVWLVGELLLLIGIGCARRAFIRKV